MLSLLMHLYQRAEVYTVMLVWIVVPLGFVSCYLFFQRQFGMFVPPQDVKESPSHGNHR